MKWQRQPFLDLMQGKPVERPMFVELFGPLIGLEEEWRQQGASEDELNLTAFDWDYVPRSGAGGSCGPLDLPPTQIIEETDTFLIQRDGLGRTMQMDKRTATIPLPLNFPVATMDDWLKLKPAFQYRDDRINRAQLGQARAKQADGHVITFGILGAYDTARNLMGEAAACMGYYDQPELMHDIIDTIYDTATRVMEQITPHVTIDWLSVHEDLAGRSGPLIGPTQIQEFAHPYYRRLWDQAHAHGTHCFSMDTDGNVNSILPALIDCGLNHIYPMEPAAGMDIVASLETYGKQLSYRGGIDKFAMMRTKEDVRRELEYKMQPRVRDGGGVVFGLDHRIPNGTPLENYRYYVQLGREMLGLPPREPAARGWMRMAF
ncbi:MAG: uroporphyrinogen decarboxylase family protein [Phycisphaeraceae bacterium]